MFSSLKEKMVAKGLSVFQSPAITRLMENEKVGVLVEKGMTLPFKISTAMMAQKGRLVALFDLATQDDVDEVKRAVARMESVLKDIRQESGELLRKVGEEEPKKTPVAS